MWESGHGRDRAIDSGPGTWIRESSAALNGEHDSRRRVPDARIWNSRLDQVERSLGLGAGDREGLRGRGGQGRRSSPGGDEDDYPCRENKSTLAVGEASKTI